MSLPFHDVAISPLLRGLTVLTDYLNLAEEHCAANGLPPTDILDARLAPDMLSFTGQLQRASDTAKGSVARIAAVDIPSLPDTETSFQDLRERIERTAAFVRSTGEDVFDDAEGRVVEMRFRSVNGRFAARVYVQQVMLPNFYFHLSTAHAILRFQGVAVGKRDYLGHLDYLPDNGV